MSTPESGSAIVIRPAREEELPKLAEFIAPFVEQQKILPRTAGELHTLTRNGFVAETNGRVIGFAALEVYSAKLAEIRSLAVGEEFRRRGVGRRLVEACLQRAGEQNVLEVMAISSEEDFFLSCGFNFTLPDEKKAFFAHTGRR